MPRRIQSDGPYFQFTYLWSGLYPTNYELDLSNSGCVQKLTWKRIAAVHTLDRGNYKRYQKGYQLLATLTWGANALLQTTYWDVDTYARRTEKILSLMFNVGCDQDILYNPWPGLHPGTYYNVIWDGDYNFNYVRGLDDIGFVGTIKLVGKKIWNEIPLSRHDTASSVIL